MNLKEFKKVNPMERRPPLGTSDAQWQKYFEALRLLIQPSKENKMNIPNSILVNGRRDKSYFVYDGYTQWQQYCKFINDVLNVIRSYSCDYCYYIYQISDLLRFEHDRLKSVWNPEYQYFEVWLEN